MFGGAALTGRVRVTGAKNSALKLMAAALLAPGRSAIDEVPDILDVEIMSEVLRRLGCGVTYDRAGSGGGQVFIDVPEEPSTETDYELVRKMRASINVLGPLVARCGSAKVALPGGDAIGSRGLDMHISGLERLGATIVSEHGYLVATAPRLTGASIWLDFPSVGATENLLMAAVLASGTTVIDNAAREPEIVDLCTMLNAMGAGIDGAGTSTLTVEGVEALSPVSYTTVALAAVSTGTALITENVYDGRFMFVNELVRLGADVRVDGHHAVVRGRERLSSAPVVATDIRAGAGLVLAGLVSDGVTEVQDVHHVDRGYPDFVDQLRGLGAQVTRTKRD